MYFCAPVLVAGVDDDSLLGFVELGFVEFGLVELFVASRFFNRFSASPANSPQDTSLNTL